MVADARANTKTFLKTYLNYNNIHKDDGIASYAIIYKNPPYPVELELKPPSPLSVLFAIGEPNSSAVVGHDHIPYAYEEQVPIYIITVDKAGVTGTTTKWSAEAELRRICEEYPLGSIRSLDRRSDHDRNLGSTTLYVTEYVMTYRRDLT